MNLASLPTSLDEAVAALGAVPGTIPVAGGTDLMVEVNGGLLEPRAIVGLRLVEELNGWTVRDGRLVLGANLTFAQLSHPDLAVLAPAVAQAAGTVGSPQIRNVGTLGGNLATAASTGDLLPVLVALGATAVCYGPLGWREIPVTELLGEQRGDRQPDELITGVRWPLTRGPQEFLKVGPRNALSLALCSLALVVDLDQRYIGCAVGALAPTPVRVEEAERWLADQVDWGTGRISDPGVYDRFADLVTRELRPVSDHRATAAYRSHATFVCARRAAQRALPLG